MDTKKTLTEREQLCVCPPSVRASTICTARPRPSQVTMAEWLRRSIRNRMGSARAGSNPAGDATFFVTFLLRVCLLQVVLWVACPLPPSPRQIQQKAYKRAKKRACILYARGARESKASFSDTAPSLSAPPTDKHSVCPAYRQASHLRAHYSLCIPPEFIICLCTFQNFMNRLCIQDEQKN